VLRTVVHTAAAAAVVVVVGAVAEIVSLVFAVPIALIDPVVLTVVVVAVVGLGLVVHGVRHGVCHGVRGPPSTTWTTTFDGDVRPGVPAAQRTTRGAHRPFGSAASKGGLKRAWNR
jgi:hypothetical protein